MIVATPGSGLVSASRAQGLCGQLAWLILLLEATASQTKGQGPLGGAQLRDLREMGDVRFVRNAGGFVCVFACLLEVHIKH